MLETPKTYSCLLSDNRKDETMDNQQATEAQKGWLAGIIDGEGCLSMRVYRRKNGYWRSSVFLKVDNTNKEIIDCVGHIFSLMNIPHYICERGRTTSHKPVYQIIVQGLKRCGNALPKIHPYLIGKRKQAELLMSFVGRRINHNKLYAGNQNYYTQQDLDDIQQIRKLNQRGRGVLNDYTLPPRNEFVGGRYSLNSDGDTEKQAEMTCSLA
jgi:hypothetical protein